jgi:DNA polymerase (family 10)
MAVKSAFEIAEVLRDVALALELGGRDRYRAAAYRRGAEALEQLNADLDRLIAEGRLTETPGLGASLAAQIAEIRRTGCSATLEGLVSAMPSGALELGKVPGMSLAAIKVLAQRLGVSNVVDLAEACANGRVRGLPGFNEKREKRILEAIERGNRKGPDGTSGTLLADALATARAVLDHLVAGERIVSAELAGDVRRGIEVVDEVAVLAVSEDANAALDRFVATPGIAQLVERGGRTATARFAGGVVVRVHVASPGAAAAALQRLTGSAAHNEQVDARAAERGLVVGIDGVTEGGRPVEVRDERALYVTIGLAFVPPPLRDGEGELDVAARGVEPRLLELADVRGFVHCHTDHSDGRHTIEEMARAAEAFGMQYITITDHSPTASYARGLEVDRLLRQRDEIDRVQERVKIKILHGTESDILKDGALDHPDHVLEKLDVVIASVHSRHQLGPAETTARIIRAMRHPLFKIWGHALGRLLLKRPPVACDVDAILGAIAESRAAVEINGDPNRLDLPPIWARRAKALGAKFVVSVDAHATGELRNVDLGVLMAQRAGLAAEDVLNTRDAAGFAAAVRPAQA